MMPAPIPYELYEIAANCRQGFRSAAGEARRLFHGRGRTCAGFEHVCIDAFAPLVLVTLFRPLPAELERQLLDVLREALLPEGMTCLAVQRRNGAAVAVEFVQGELPADLQAREAGLHYRVDAARGQNLGFFLDMRIAREWLAERAQGKSILNLFAFTCAFSVVARKAGAARIVNIDMSRASLAIGRENHQINALPTDDIHFLDHDIFRSWNKLHRLGRYDIAIMDPPTLQKGSFIVEKDYGKVVRRFSKLLKPEGDVLACLNAPHLGEDFLDEIFARELPGTTRVGRLPNPPEFADVEAQAALKVVHYRYARPADMPPLSGVSGQDEA